MQADRLSFYAGQSAVTDPVKARLAGLPPDVAGLQRVARGLVLHYRGEDLTSPPRAIPTSPRSGDCTTVTRSASRTP